MDLQLLIICLLTFGINLIGTLAYGARIAGVRTLRLAISIAPSHQACRSSSAFSRRLQRQKKYAGISPMNAAP